MSILDDLRANPHADIKTEGYVIDVVDGRVIMTPQGPDRDDTIFDVRSQIRDQYGKSVKTASDVFVDFPGETSFAPDVAILDADAVRHGNRYVCTNVLAAVEFVSVENDVNDYVTKVAKYGRFGIATYLIIDPFKQVCTLLEGPTPTGYAERTEIPFGEHVELRLADGRSIDIDTSDFPDRKAK
ncbi:Uma2 family endonuclease [Streptantibioticus ferralitis]|uniref:Uma2 family endonuclease n=1 Tax=Streptantibioticus ferralitis TaxID=236510 RepID=A0ABT5YRG2_9ACTN|nr:Uma2 family endonuclease [Streptantibioticus ferralitis]MDF2254183.1 Uma2 family endonuclease [Streptantibioticus ferralitis]